MPRPKIDIDLDKLKESIAKAEANQLFPNRNKLFEFVAKEFGCAAIIIRNRVLEHNIPLVTLLGKRGRSPGEGTGIPAGKRERKAVPELFRNSIQRTFGSDKRVGKKIGLVINGSLKAAIALKCYDCCGRQAKEVANCTITSCPLWAFRPWKGNPEELNTVELDLPEQFGVHFTRRKRKTQNDEPAGYTPGKKDTKLRETRIPYDSQKSSELYPISKKW